MGSDYKYLDNYDKAILYYKKSLSICQEIGNEGDIAEALINLSTGYSAMGNDSAAYELIQQSFKICKKINDLGGLCTCYLNIGADFLEKKQLEQAIENFRLALKYSKLIGYKKTESQSLYDIGLYFNEKNKLDSAIFYYNQSLIIAIKYGFKEGILSCYKTLSEAFIDNKMPYDAYQQLIKYNQIRDTILYAKKNQEIDKIESNFDKYKEQLQITTEKQKRKLLFIIFVLSILIFSFGFIYLVKQYKRSLYRQQMYSQNLIEEKSKIEENLSEKDKELITYSLQLAQKQEIENALADRIKGEIEGSSGETKKTLQSILNNIIVESQRVNIWEDFEVRFNQVNKDFYQNLLEKHPSLTKNERRLCAFMKLNLSTKEITIITGQSPHSINVARTRLRKKLNLSNNNQNLPDYLQSF
jgi:tetratricopeptide (TPR) repeat protein